MFTSTTAAHLAVDDAFALRGATYLVTSPPKWQGQRHVNVEAVVLSDDEAPTETLTIGAGRRVELVTTY